MPIIPPCLKKHLVHAATPAFIPIVLLPAPLHAGTGLTVIILRHGGKPEAGLGQLSCQGLNRALLALLLLERFGKPDAIHAPNPSVRKPDRGGVFFYVRPLATIEPFAIRAGMPVETRHGYDGIEPLAQDILKAGGTHVVAWEHHMAVGSRKG